MIDREEFIIERCAGKKVLHIGCCATPACKEESEKGTLLHLNLAKSASELWGLDMSREDITFLQDQYQIENLVAGDAELIDKSFPPGAFDVIVAGELIEHLRNPGLFLVGARGLLAPGGTIIVSVPNGIAFRRGLKSLFGRETVHPDHNFYFSKKTLAHLLVSCGYEMVEIHGYRMMRSEFFGAWISDLFASIFSQWACEGIVETARPSP